MGSVAALLLVNPSFSQADVSPLQSETLPPELEVFRSFGGALPFVPSILSLSIICGECHNF